MSRGRAFALVALGVLGLAALKFAGGRTEQDGVRVPVLQPSSTAAPATASVPVVLRPVAPKPPAFQGGDLVYDLAASHEVVIEPLGPRDTPPTRIGVAVRAELTLETYGSLADGDSITGYRFTRVELKVEARDAIPTPTLSRGEQATLARPVLAVRDVEGRIRNLLFDSAVTPEERWLLRGWIAETQVGLARDAGTRAEWQLEEENTTGVYVGHSRVTARSGARATLERKKVYTQLFAGPAGDTGPLLAPPTCEGGTRAEVDLERRHVVALETNEKLALGGDGSLGVRLGATARVSLKLKSERAVDGLERARRREELARWRAYLRPTTSPGVFRPEPGERQVAGDTAPRDLRPSFERALQELQAAAERNAWAEESPRAFLQFSAAFRADERLVEGALAMIRGGIYRQDVLATLVDALADAGTRAAQAGLAKLLGEAALPTATRAQIASSLGVVRDPAESVLAALKTSAGATDAELAGAAIRSLGQIARGARSDLCDALAADLAGRLEKAPSSTKAAIVEALGTAAAPASLPVITRHAGSDDESVRASATQALARFVAPEVDALLVKALAGDASPRVRAAALSALSGRKSAAAQDAIVAALKDDADLAVRVAALEVVAELARSDDKVREVLKAVAASDRSEAVRDLAAQAVDRAR